MALTILDAGVMIGFWDLSDAHHPAARAALVHARQRGEPIALPASALAESLVGTARLGDDSMQAARSFLARFPIEVIPLDIPIAEAAARLRAAHPGLRLPDALVIATAQVLEADTLVTTDRRWPAPGDLPFEGEVIAL